MAVELRQTGLTTVVLSRDYIWPVNKQGHAFQVIARRGNGRPQVAKLAPSEQIWSLIFRQLTVTDRDNIWNFITDALVDYSLHEWTFVDVDSTLYTARYMLDRLEIPEGTDGNYEWRPELRVVAQ